jgi:hypothetical protein
MKKCRKVIAALILSAATAAVLSGCGNGDTAGYSDGGSQLPSTVSVKTGSIASDSWGYTGAAPVSLSAPTGTAVVMEGRSLLLDDSHAVVSGSTATDVRFSSDVTTLSSAAQAAVPGTFVSYLSISIGSVQTVSPVMSVSAAAATLPVGEAVSIYTYDSASRSWKLVQTATVASAGIITFAVTGPGLYAVFR